MAVNIKKILKKYSAFIISFCFTKGAVYIVPLLLADILSPTDFGILEYALAGLGFVINSIISLGVPGAYPFFILKQKESYIKNGFLLHPIILFGLFLINQCLYFFLHISIEFYMAFNISYIIANQVLYSTKLKSHESPTRAIFIDSGIYLLLGFLIVTYYLNLLNLSINMISCIILYYSLLYSVIGIYEFVRKDKNKVFFNYTKILKYSINIMFGSFFIFLITSSGRILAEYFFTFKEVAVYGFYFRLSAIVVMIYQMINIIFFKKLYTINIEILDKYYSLFFLCVFLASFLIYLLAPFILTEFSQFFNDTFYSFKKVYFLLSAQMLMWIATALNSSIIDRENLVKQNNIRFVILLVLSGFTFFFVKEYLSLDLLVFIHYSIIFAATLIQYYTLKRSKIIFNKSIFVLIISYVFTIIYYLLT